MKQKTDDDHLQFRFGANWADYISRHFSDERVEIASRHMLGFLKRPDLRGMSFLDVGCGSGLHSLAAWRAGARPVVSFDLDPVSVATARRLRAMAGDPAGWTVTQGSVLDESFMRSLAPADIVYSWGVLHHTGRLWAAIELAASRLHASSVFYVALYSRDAFTDPPADYWLTVKRRYNRSTRLGRAWMEWKYAWNHSIRDHLQRRKNPFAFMRQHKAVRGMSYWHDVRDWLGGYPMEFAGNKQTEAFCKESFGLDLLHIRAGDANTEFLFGRRACLPYWVALESAAPLVELPGPFEHDAGFAWRAALPPRPDGWGRGERFMLYENGSPVGWPNQGLDFIRAWGLGRYRIDDGTITLSTTDNAHPNGRRYQFRVEFA